MLYKFLKLDWILILASFLLLTIGLVALYSISVSEETNGEISIFSKQLIFAIIGIVMMFGLSFVDYRYFRSHSKIVYFFMVFLLVGVLLVGTITRGTVGWLTIGSFHIQPVELAKVLLILSLASFITKSTAVLSELARIVTSVVLASVAIFLTLQQPDFGSALVLVSILIAMILLSGIEWKYLVAIIFIGIIMMIGGWFSLAGYQKDRLVNFINPGNDPQGSGYNVIQSVIAVGSGGIMGKGLGQGSQSQLNFLPENHTDFIFAVIIEEFGVLGGGIVLFLFLVILYRLKKIAEIATNNFGYLIMIGSLAMFFVQITINIGMNMGIMPVTGIPLIFLSYGGSSLISAFIILGIANNIFIIGKKSVETKIKTENTF